jgi:hypothetical protein
MRRAGRFSNFSWIWAAGCAAWTFDAIVQLRLRNTPHAELAFVLAVLFGIAWGFYRQQKG